MNTFGGLYSKMGTFGGCHSFWEQTQNYWFWSNNSHFKLIRHLDLLKSILDYCKGPNDTQAPMPYWCCQIWPYQPPQKISIGSLLPQNQLKFIPNMHLIPHVAQLFPPKHGLIALHGYRWPPYVSTKPILSDIGY